MGLFGNERKRPFQEAEDAEERRVLRDNQRDPPPLQAQVQILQPADVTVNLYEKYIERMDKYADKPKDIMPFLFKEYRYGKDTTQTNYSIVKNPNFYTHTNWGNTSVFGRAETFSTLFCIILGHLFINNLNSWF